ncbi:hypothetical protein BT96DRAFT_916635 [Gymnopus androsaceus JB14]|uniref:HMG box domain-containing protein n=1 Tax=Gymnopus androsaceus JB14 TaxID=1447944 RepID=A0A6A4I7H7_9AGAR|nr:hypothetical protein BT96DRAFT_916635 [Gymnopus androsaceus JB14]
MPATRSWARRKSSLGLVSTPPAKPGVYGIQAEPNRLTFCPNVTPSTFKIEAEAEDMYDDLPGDDSSATLFPPSSAPAPPPRKRRAPPGKRRSLGYIPRPPNAFMLFRADFVKQKHVPNSIETNHSSLSKIIGSCWRSLPIDEKAVWEKRARVEKAEHKRKYPEYRFRPVHNKNKNKAADTLGNKKMKMDPLPPSMASIEGMRTEREGFIAQCLLDGLKGDALKEQRDGGRRNPPVTPAANTNSAANSFHSPMPAPVSRYPSRRSSSVPLPNDFLPFQGGYQQPQQYFSQYSDATFPNMAESSHGLSMDLAGYSDPSLPHSFNMLPSMNSALRPPSPSPTNFDVGSISRQQRMVLGGRRASSAQAFVNYGRPEDSWPTNWDMQGQWVGANWQSGYGATGTSPSSSASSLPLPLDGDELPEADTSLFQSGFTFGASSIPSQQPSPFDGQQACNPFEGYNMEQQPDFVQNFLQEQQNQIHHLSLAPLDTHSYSPLDTSPMSSSSVHSYSPSYSGSPAPSEVGERELQLHAPQPIHPTSIENVDVDANVNLAYPDHDSPAQSMQDIQTSESHSAIETESSSTSSLPIDSAMAFTELWKGLSSSGSFAVAMGFPLDHNTTYAFQPSPVLGTENGPESSANTEHDDQFAQILRDQHEQLALASGR